MKRLLTILLLIPVLVFSQATTFNLTALNTDFIRPDASATLWNEQDAFTGTFHIPTSSPGLQMQDAYHRFGMTQFFNNASASDSTIIFTDLDDFFNMAIDHKMGVRFRVMGLCNNCGNPPGDNFNNQVQYGNGWQVVPEFLHNLQQADANPDKRDWFSTRGDQHAWVPNVNSWPFQRWVGKLSLAIKNHINSTSHNGVNYGDVLKIYDLGYNGCYSEQHYNCLCDNISEIPLGARHNPDDSGVMAIVNQQTNAFGGDQRWKIVVPFNAYDAIWLPHTYNTVAYGNFLLNHPDSIGYIDDHIGADEGYDHSYLEDNNRVNNSKLMSRWKYSPIGGEPVEWGSPADRSAIPAYAQTYHMSFIGNGNMNGFYTNANTTEANNFRLASSRLGYKLRLTGGSANVGASLTINLNWQNIGNAPPYWNWTVQYLLKNGAGTTASTLTSAFNPRYFQPSTSAVTKTDVYGIPAIPAGQYGLYVIVKDPLNYRNPMPLANTPQQGDGSYFLGNITIPAGGTNTPPTVNAGANQSISGTSTSVTAVASDPDGTISSYAWSQVGATPNTATIVSPTAASTSITGLISGTYTFNVTVTDNSGATASDQIQITVTTANQPPIANAGPNVTLTLPTNFTQLNGTGSSDDHGIVSYHWQVISGPATYTLLSPDFSIVNFESLQVGTYTVRLTVVDASGLSGFDDVTVTVIGPNNPPIANAGPNVNVTLPVINNSSVLLDGSLSSDPGGAVTTYFWTQVGGPATVTIAAPTNVATYINNVTIAGQYIFRLTVTDNLGLTNSDDVFVNVTAPTALPQANAGANQTITLPTNTVALSGSGSTGIILSYSWSQQSGPNTATISFPTAVNITPSNLIAGVYTFRLTVCNSSGCNFDDVAVTVLAAANQAPIANAGGNSQITLPTTTVAANGTGSTDPDGTITGYLWTFVSGPAVATFSAANSSTTNVNNLTVAGTYTVRLRVTDNGGLTDTDDKIITVTAAANNPPVAIIAGGPQTIQLPTNIAYLDGQSSTDDVAIVSYLWQQLSGPGQATIVTPTADATDLNNLVAGVYFFQLTVTDGGGLTDTDIIQVTVLPAVAEHPMNGDRILMPGLKFLPRYGHP